MQVIRAAEFREGRWKNGLGVSWDIASDPPGAGMDDFGWRFAIARIDGDVPFSAYPQVDRVFTLIEGEGLTLEIEGQAPVAVDRRFVPHAFPGDVATACRLHGGPCRALNLFLMRGAWRAEARVERGPVQAKGKGPLLVFALQGGSRVGGQTLEEGDAAITEGNIAVEPGTDAMAYLAALSRA